MKISPEKVRNEGYHWPCTRITFVFDHVRQLDGHLIYFLVQCYCGWSSLSVCLSCLVCASALQENRNIFSVLVNANHSVYNCICCLHSGLPTFCFSYLVCVHTHKSPVAGLREHTSSSSALRMRWERFELSSLIKAKEKAAFQDVNMASVCCCCFAAFMRYLVRESVRIYMWNIPTVNFKWLDKSIVSEFYWMCKSIFFIKEYIFNLFIFSFKIPFLIFISYLVGFLVLSQLWMMQGFPSFQPSVPYPFLTRLQEWNCVNT